MKKILLKLLTVLALGIICLAVCACSLLGTDQTGTDAQNNNNNDNLGGYSFNSSITGISMINSSDGDTLTPEQVAAKIIPSVVCVLNYNNGSLASTGSGVIFDKEGYIITNAHVVEGQTALSVILYDDTVRDATLVASDAYSDLAIMKIDVVGLTVTPASFSSSSALTVGSYAMTCGSPGGTTLRNSVSLGIISGLNRNVETVSGYTVNCIQVDAAINPGNSGGALVDMKGNVIGIPSSKIVSTSYEGLGFAISSDFAENIIDELIHYGYVRGRATLGISLTEQYIRSNAGYFGYTIGYTVTAITNQSAIYAGLRAGDYVLKIAGQTIYSTEDVAKILKDMSPGDDITLTIRRNNTQYLITFALIELTN